MKAIKSCLSLLLAGIVCMMALAIPASAETARASISLSKSSVNVGDTFQVQVKFSASSMGMAAANLKFNAETIEFVSGGSDVGAQAGTVYMVSNITSAVSSYTFTMTFRAKKTGQSKFSLEYDNTRNGVFDWNSYASLGTPTASATVSIADVQQSSNANLSSMRLSAGALSPAFSPNTTSYQVTVPNSVATLTVSVTTADPNATVGITGSKNLKVGENTRVVTVTAPSGATKSYTLKITRQAAATSSGATSNGTASTSSSAGTSSGATSSGTVSQVDPLAVTWNGTDYYIAEDWKGAEVPEGFTVQEITYQGVAVPAAVSKDGSVTLLYLLNSNKDAGSFFRYDPSSSTFSDFHSVAVEGGVYVLLTPPAEFTIPEGYVAASRTVGSQEVTAYVREGDADSDFCLVWALSPGGNQGLYQFDAAEGTMQRFAQEQGATAPSKNTIASMFADPLMGKILAGALIAIGLVILAIILILVLKRRAVFGNASQSDPMLPMDDDFRIHSDDDNP